MAERYFTPQTLAFLAQLAENNTRAWFEEHQQEYEEFVRTPALEFISDMAGEMSSLSLNFQAQAQKVGGSLLRIHRDTRFSRDKTPYKTNIGIQFRHKLGKDIHAPGYYLHIEPGGCFLGVGLWRPDAEALGKIREAIVQHCAVWLAARDARMFRKHFSLAGDSLVNAPRGFAKDHPMVEDLRRKDFIGLAPLTETMATAANLRPLVVERFRHAAPFMRFLCMALDVQF
ncbi:MAG: TIGR02453 family protein [Desulfobulbaceae bacterium A2]|nr:MAG: TIGR02453 family protein [Desulfobulbaceae bacterium A2]